MTRNDLEQAAKWNENLKRAERDLDAIKEYEVVGVVVSRKGSTTANAIRIERGGGSGTGSINSIGWTEDMQADVTTAFQGVFKSRIAVALNNLESFGVKAK